MKHPPLRYTAMKRRGSYPGDEVTKGEKQGRREARTRLNIILIQLFIISYSAKVSPPPNSVFRLP